MPGHVPMRPDWHCIHRGCGPWPCPGAKAELRADLPPLSLALYAGQCLTDALADLPHVPPGELHHRILGWVRVPADPTAEAIDAPAPFTTRDVRRATTGEIGEIAAVLADTLTPTPVGRWLVPDLLARPRIIADILAVTARRGVIYDHARVLDDDAGVAAVLVVEPAVCDQPTGVAAEWAGRLTAAAGNWSRRLVQLTAAANAARASEQGPRVTHLGVRRDRIGDGLDDVLLAWYAEQLDDTGEAAHTVTGDERAVTAYLRAGWHRSDLWRLPDGGPTLWVLRRVPGPGAR